MSKKGKKLTYEYVKNYIEKEGYTLLSNTYKNANTKLNIKCPEDHQYEVIFNSFKKGHRCPYCAGNKKLTYEYVKNYIEKEGYILLSNDIKYKDVYTKFKIQCPKGHVYYILFNDFKSGHRCSICYHINKKH